MRIFTPVAGAWLAATASADGSASTSDAALGCAAAAEQAAWSCAPCASANHYLHQLFWPDVETSHGEPTAEFFSIDNATDFCETRCKDVVDSFGLPDTASEAACGGGEAALAAADCAVDWKQRKWDTNRLCSMERTHVDLPVKGDNNPQEYCYDKIVGWQNQELMREFVNLVREGKWTVDHLDANIDEYCMMASELGCCAGELLFGATCASNGRVLETLDAAKLAIKCATSAVHVNVNAYYLCDDSLWYDSSLTQCPPKMLYSVRNESANRFRPDDGGRPGWFGGDDDGDDDDDGGRDDDFARNDDHSHGYPHGRGPGADMAWSHCMHAVYPEFAGSASEADDAAFAFEDGAAARDVLGACPAVGAMIAPPPAPVDPPASKLAKVVVGLVAVVAVVAGVVVWRRRAQRATADAQRGQAYDAVGALPDDDADEAVDSL